MKLAKLELNKISEVIDPFAIKNFIISDNSTSEPLMSPDYPFVLDGVAFAMCIGGNGRIKINFREYDLTKNTIITILPYFVTEIIERSDDFILEFLIFSTDFLSDMPSSSNFDVSKSILQSSCIQATEIEAGRILEFHSFIVKQYKRVDHPFRKEIARCLLFSLLSEIGSIYYLRMKETGQTGTLAPAYHQEELVYKFFKLLLKHHQGEKNPQFYAGKMYITPKYLSAVLKERTGRTAFSWINEALITSSKYMLKTTNLTILQISEEMNFPNPSFFGRFFKKHTGMTPMQYREN